jgi:hypothetical protein
MIPSSGYSYLCSPYSHVDPEVKNARYLATLRETAALLKIGLFIYSPIVHCHELARIANLPTDAEFWKKYNYCMIAAAECVKVLMLDGWRESVGIEGEVIEAQRLGIPVTHIEPIGQQ